MKIIYKNLGLIDYKRAWDTQEKYFNEVITAKIENKKNRVNYLFFCEHPHVYTLGKSGVQSNLLINDNFLKSINATYYASNRGGDITYHGPGQIVGYPILDLDNIKLSIKQYISKLEEVIILTLKTYNLKADRLDGATGVWLDTNDKTKVRKICAIGVRASRWVTMHGFALNINTDLSYFNHINPCGFVDKGVTSLQKELNEKVDMDGVRDKLLFNFGEIFGFEFIC